MPNDGADIAANITALVLAGGRGTRMGSVEKGLQLFRGKSLVAHAIARLAAQAPTLAISANRCTEQYRAFGWPVWPDLLADFPGPLAGLHCGLTHCRTPYLATAPCDSPLLPFDLLARLSAALQREHADAAFVVAGAARRRHPVFCLLHKRLLPALTQYMQDGGRKMESWFDQIHAVEVHFDDETAFSNINTLQELHQLEAQSMTQRSLSDIVTCLSDYDPNAMTVSQAQKVIHDFVQPIASLEQTAIRSALGRTLAQEIVATVNVPSGDNAAMDGYALRGDDLADDGPVTLQIAGSIQAGQRYQGTVAPGQCVRIMTGAPMPADCDTVVPQEFTEHHGADAITIPPGRVRRGDNRRLCGEDLRIGQVALRAGKLLRPADIGMLASLGVPEVKVQRRLRVAFFSTGDELRSVGEALEPGCVYDSNRYTLYGMLTRLGCDIIDMGVVKDDPAAMEAAFRSACEQADAVITSGGVSVGAADYTKQTMTRLGDMQFWKVNMRPGRPMAFGRIASRGSSAYVFGLPGNPVAVMVSFYFFVRDALLRMMGATAGPLPRLRAKSLSAIRKKPGRTEYQRGILAPDADGEWTVSLTGTQGSGILRSMADANCILVLEDAQGDVACGDLVQVVVFDGLV